MDIENKNINSLRMLAIDMIENAKSGHPGIALGAAPTIYSLYSKVLNVVPDDDKNIFRDRFVLSAGHGSGILYATLHAFGYDISIDDLKNFRKVGSKTPGHPEYSVVPGVDASTGPLGQGVAMAVGMAIGEKLMASRFNKIDLTLFDNYTYALAGEGCLMEGVSYEALSLAGALKLNQLIVLYDCNNVTLDGGVNGVMDFNILAYMKSLNFNTLEVQDGNDVNQIVEAINLAKRSKDKPSFIKINTHIGFGSVYEDSNKSHGTVLGAENAQKLREKLGVTTNPFELSKDVIRDFSLQRKRFDNIKKGFKEKLKKYSRLYPGEYKVLQNCLKGEFTGILEYLQTLTVSEDMSGRDMGGLVINALCDKFTNIIVGSADLSSSTKVVHKKSPSIDENFAGRNIKFGVREFAMGCISNGISMYGGFVPVNSTFLSFSDYMKSSLRLGAIAETKAISVFTHDSIAVGEDGPTHQPCEQIWTLRSIPNMQVFRPANMTEVKVAYVKGLTENKPTSIILSRQKLKNFESNYADASCGAYIVSLEENGKLDGIIIATGSEVSLALDVKNTLKNRGYSVRVISMPSVDLFESQSDKYKLKLLPNDVKSVFTIEAGSTMGWYKYTGKCGKAFGVDEFGLSGNEIELYKKFNLNSDYIANEIAKIIKINK